MKLKLFAFLFAAIFSVFSLKESFAQARLVLGNGAAPSAIYMHISGGAFLVVGDATAAAAPNTITRNAGWIISGDNGASPVGAGNTGQNNRVRWYIGGGTGTYTVPWGWSTTDYIPLTFTIGTAGAPAVGPYFTFSTYRLTSCTNSAAGNLPTLGSNPPVNYSSPAVPGDASNWGVDRFWMIDASGYTTNPDLDGLQFTYVDGATSEIGTISCANSITEANLQAQRWNTSINDWEGGSWIKGTVNTGSNTVTLAAADVAVSDLAHRWWTLVDKNYPLPVNWLNFDATCERGNRIVKWSTASEQNADYFSVERSLDGVTFASIGTVKAAGNSSTVKNYSFTDTDVPVSAGAVYYRVTEYDFNGSSMSTPPVVITSPCLNDDVIIYGSDGGAVISVTALADGMYNVEMYNALGQSLAQKAFAVTAGNNVVKIPTSVASGVYIVKVYNEQNSIAKKIFIRSQPEYTDAE